MSLAHTYNFEAIGTPWSIDTATPLSAHEKQKIHRLIDNFDQTYSRFREDSLVSQVRKNGAGSYEFPDTISALYNTYAALEKATNGAVNPLVGEALEQLGYDAQYSLKPTHKKPDHPQHFSKTVQCTANTLTFLQPALLDIGAVGKGYLVDLVAESIAQNHRQYVVEAGGDMRIKTAEPYTIGLENPIITTETIGTVSLQNASICASSPNRRSWGKGLHHIIDARTGQPTNSDIVATWAIAPKTMLADALTTALFFTPAAQLQTTFGEFTYIIMRSDGRVEHSIT